MMDLLTTHALSPTPVQGPMQQEISKQWQWYKTIISHTECKLRLIIIMLNIWVTAE